MQRFNKLQVLFQDRLVKDICSSTSERTSSKLGFSLVEQNHVN